MNLYELMAEYKQWEISKILSLKSVLQWAELHYSDVQLTL